jgi:predicted esterase
MLRVVPSEVEGRRVHEITKVDVHHIDARVHGRYLVERPDGSGVLPILVGFHGYGENAQHMLEALRALAPAGWLLVSIQALNRFYTKKQGVVGSWMTREDRELAIADNTDYVGAVIDRVNEQYSTRRPAVFVGFSQGVAMAYRAAVAPTSECDALVVLAGDIPPDVAPKAASLPPVLIGRGTADEWYTEAKAANDVRVLAAAGVAVSEHVFEAGHVWDPGFITRAQQFLASVVQRA